MLYSIFYCYILNLQLVLNIWFLVSRFIKATYLSSRITCNYWALLIGTHRIIILKNRPCLVHQSPCFSPFRLYWDQVVPTQTKWTRNTELYRLNMEPCKSIFQLVLLHTGFSIGCTNHTGPHHHWWTVWAHQYEGWGRWIWELPSSPICTQLPTEGSHGTTGNTSGQCIVPAEIVLGEYIQVRKTTAFIDSKTYK